MEQDLVQRIALLVVYSLILVPVVRWGIRNAKKEVRNGVPPLTWRRLFTKGLLFALWCGSFSGILAVFLGRKFDHPIGRAIWGPIYVAILCFILGVLVIPVGQLLSERRFGAIRYRPREGKRVPPIRSVTALIQGGLAFLSAFLTSLAITFLRNGEINWKRSFLVGLSIFITYFIVLVLLRPGKESV